MTTDSTPKIIGDGGIVTSGSASGAPVKVGAEANSVEPLVVADGSVNPLITDLHRQLVLAGYEWISELLRTGERAPISTHFEVDVITLDNLPDASADVSALIPMDGSRGCSVQLVQVSGGGTYSWHMDSSVESALAAASFRPSTLYGWSAASILNAATYTSSEILYSNPGFTPRAHRLSLTPAGTGGTNQYKLYIKKWY
jgi:hypothetical protein